MILTADFETNNYADDCRVWSWGLCDVTNPDIYMNGKTIEEFIETIKLLSYEEKITIWFHNLKFDGSFIMYYLLTHGYAYVEDSNTYCPNSVSALIGDMGQWYSMHINFRGAVKEGSVTINDSMKVLPFSVASVARSFGLEESKGTIDYQKWRAPDYELTPEEYEYQKTDCTIMAKALNRMHHESMTRITAGANALANYKKSVTKREYEKWFPEIDCDDFIRKSYRGGWVYANPKYRGKKVGKGRVYDVNSLYPSRMRYELFPYGTPTYYTGAYKEDKSHPLYVQRLECSFELKRGKLPTIQIKGSTRFHDTEYVTTSNGEIQELTLTSVDLKLFLEHYNVKRLVYLDGYKFKAQYGMFNAYIDYWIDRKVEAEKHGDKAGRTLAKLYQNSLYGKFAKRPKTARKHPYIEDSILKFRLGEEEEVGALYIPVGTFTTAYARYYSITGAQKNYKVFLYADTDSLHLLGDKEPIGIEVDKYKLGAWKHESTFIRAIYIGSKCYIEEEIHTPEEVAKYKEENPDNIGLIDEKKNTILKITCAGMPERLHKKVRFDDFKVGWKSGGKLIPKQVPGGVVLIDTTFEIKERIC